MESLDRQSLEQRRHLASEQYSGQGTKSKSTYLCGVWEEL